MTLKMKLTSLIASFTLVIGLMLMGVFAVNQATVNMGGSINFTATDVYARVTGKIENAQGEYADKELPPLEFSAENDTPDQSEWSGLNLLFDDDATPIVITVKVENLAKDRKLTASLTDNTATNENLVKDLKQDGVTYTSGETKELIQSTGHGTSTTTYVITFSIADRNNSLPQMDFEFDVNLVDESALPPVNYSDLGYEFKVTSSNTVELSHYDGTESVLIIPDKVSRNEEGDWITGKDYSVTTILDGYDWGSAIEGYGYLTKIVFPSTIERIGDYALFQRTPGVLEEVDLSKCINLKSIGYCAFEQDFAGDEEIQEKSIIIKGLNNCVSLENIEARAFSGCVIDSYLDFSNFENLTNIGEFAFRGCYGITGIDIGQNVECIGSCAFTDNYNLIETINVDANNTTYYSQDNCIIEATTGSLIKGCKNSIIPSNIKSIGEEAFRDCTGLTGTLDLSNCTSLTSIGEMAFSGCSGLTSIILPSNLTSIGNSAFSGCSNLQPSVTEQGVKYLGNSDNPYLVLWDGTDITSTTYTVNNNCRFIYDSAFSGCSGLTSITLPSSLTSIGSYAFSGCSGFISLDFTNCTSLASIGDWAFNSCHGLASISLSSSLASIGDSAFYNCSGLKELDLSNCISLTSIGIRAFYGCSKLTELDLSNCTSLTSIGIQAFYNCSGLTSITLPSSLTSIGSSAFYNCRALTEINYNAESIPDLRLNNGVFSYAGQNGSGITVNFGEGVKNIPAYLFYSNSNISRLNFSSTIESIGTCAFLGCSGLTSITLSSSLISIGDSAFSGCSNLQPSVTEQGVKYLGNSDNPYLVLWDGSDITTSTYTVNENCKIIYYEAFEDCSGLTSITLPSSLTSIGGSAFSYCSGLTSITLPSSLTSIGDYAFRYCTGLTEVDLSQCTSLASIGDSAFNGCHGLTSITIPERVTSIGDWAFSDCINLQPSATEQGVKYLGNSDNPYLVLWDGADITSTTYTVNNNCRFIYDSAFSGCSGLTSITLPSSLTSIGDSAFEDCSGLTSITLPSSLTSIGDSAFYNCSGLTSIDLSNCISLASIGDSAFEDCGGLTSIDLSNCTSLTSIGGSAFYGCTNLTSIVFPNSTGWYYTTSLSDTTGTSMDMTNPYRNATWLTDGYSENYFKRNA